MSRFAGSRMQLPDFGGNSGNTPSFAPMSFASGGVSSNAGAAADAVSVGRAFGTIRKNAPNVQKTVETAADIKTAENIGAMEAEAGLISDGLAAYGSAKRSAMEAEMYDKMAAQKKQGGMMSAIGGIAGGALSLVTGGLF